MKKLLLAFLVLGVFLYGCTQPPQATPTPQPSQVIDSATPTATVLPTISGSDVDTLKDTEGDSDALDGLGDDELDFPEEPA